MASTTFRTATRALSRPGVFAPRLRAGCSVQTRLASSAAPVAPTPQSNLEVAPQNVPTAEDFERDPQLAGLGYPQLPEVSRQKRPALANWWDRQERINFNETLPESDDTLSMWAPDVHKEPPSKAFAQLALMSGILASFAGLIFLSYPTVPVRRREYPYDGLVRELSGTDDQQYAAIEKQPEVNPEDYE